MSNETDKLAAAMQNMTPSKAARKRGMDAAMAAFDTEFTVNEAAMETATDGKTSKTTQGLNAAARPTGHTTHADRGQTFGSSMMTKFNQIFSFTPRTAMMGGSCMAALIAAMIIFPTTNFNTGPVIPSDPSAVPIVEIETDTPSDPVVVTPAPLDPIVETPVVIAEPVVATDSKTATAPDITIDIKPDTPTDTLPADPTVEETPLAVIDPDSPTDPAIKTTPDLPSNVVTITRQIMRTPASTTERVLPAIPKTVTREVIKTPARTVERSIPAVTKQETRRVMAADGTYKTVTETVVVQAASVELVTIPAEYETVTETVVVQEASTELVTVPATYDTVTETVMINADGSTEVLSTETVPSLSKVAEAKTSVTDPTSTITSADDLMSKVRKDAGSLAPADRESEAPFLATPEMEYDEIIVTASKTKGGRRKGRDSTPAPVASATALSVTTTAELGDMKLAGRVIERTIPAVTKQRARRVIKTPARTTERVIPAVTQDVTVKVLTEDGSYKEVTKTFVITPARTEYVGIPPTYETVMETYIVEPARTELVMVNPDGSIIAIPPKPQPTPQSGLLTAGDYDDVLNPDLYKVYLDKMLQGQLRGKDLPYIDADQRVNIRIIDLAGKPVPMANISLRSSTGQDMFPLRTGADGMAYLYPGYDNLKPGIKLEVSVDGAMTVRKRLSRSLIKNGGDIVLTLGVEAQPVKKLDLLLTIDATGSMGDEMRYLQTELKAIIGRVEKSNPGIDIRTGLVVYRDKGDEYVVREIPFTDDLEDFREKLSAQKANGGGDTPEAMHTAMNAGIKMDWRDDALKVNLLVADAPPHDQYITDTWEAGLLSRTRGIHIVPLAASGVDKTAEFLMRSMAQITGGRFLFLTDDSGVGNPHAEPSVDCYIVTRLDGLVTRVLSSLIKGERVEPEAGEVIRSVGNYRSGTCDIDRQQVSASRRNANYKDEQ